ncbi:MBL fold metallo-hydrolase [Lutispora thermophila]|uniref:Metallo-beta-lactamase superfamily protein n=1 Tax=Lutispora thermophila DSM 19022 TaxID=1122184 RepID=A0A1M6CJM3_9FIRM|nr:hypothetical protein [Lutispora thermophila]SHI61225.1 hypothetical protein SAMN02745176_00813 [Lutispora thermophila DSM 19022]
MYLYDIHAVFDTLECISEELNSFDIYSVSYIFYTHFHPDHTMDCRIIEEIREEKADKLDPIIVNHPKSGIDISFNKRTPILNLFEQAGYRTLNSDETIKGNDILVMQITLDNKFACGYLIEKNNKKLFYCPCHAMHIPKNMDVLKKLMLCC